MGGGIYSGSLYQRLAARVPNAVVFDEIGAEGENTTQGGGSVDQGRLVGRVGRTGEGLRRRRRLEGAAAQTGHVENGCCACGSSLRPATAGETNAQTAMGTLGRALVCGTIYLAILTGENSQLVRGRV
jgi:hypothetical protein